MIIEFYIYLAIVIGLVTIGMILAYSLYNAFNWRKSFDSNDLGQAGAAPIDVTPYVATT